MHPRQIPVLSAQHRWAGLSRAGGGRSVTGSRNAHPNLPRYSQHSRAGTFGAIQIWSPGSLLTIDRTHTATACSGHLPIPRYEGHVGDTRLPLDRDRSRNAVTHTACPGRAYGTPAQCYLMLILERSTQQQSYPSYWEGAGLTPEAPFPSCSPQHSSRHTGAAGEEPRIPKLPSWGWPARRKASRERGHGLCSGCGAEREEADGRHPRNSSLFCSFMAYDKQGSKSPSGSPSSSLFICCSCWESASS